MFIKYYVIIFCFECYFNLEVKTKTKTKTNQLNRRLRLSLQQNGVVPDVIDTIPQNILRVQYPSGVGVNLGNELTPTSVKDEPSVEWPVEEGAYYTLSLSDPDAPNRKDPSYGEVKHWLVVNIPGKQISKGETLAAYIGSGPRKDTGLHRYVFLVFKQNAIIKHSETPVGNRSLKGRLRFKIRKFAQKYHLGQPIAANFYKAQYDDFVPVFHSRFTQN